MDTIDLSNLNRQFLYRQGDVGQSKAKVAAAFINKRIENGVKVIAHHCRIQEKSADFYRRFNVIIGGVDSVDARRWLNGMVLSLLEYSDRGVLNQETFIPLIDGATEGFQGNVRVILPGHTPCMDCDLSLFPPKTHYPMCTIASTPRQPEHCIEYVKMIQWPKEKPFKGLQIDGDNPVHVQWVCDAANVRAAEYKIEAIDYRLTQGVLKNIMPAVASTNAVIAAACCTEVLKIVSYCFKPLQNYLYFNQLDGVHMSVFDFNRKDDCQTCVWNAVVKLHFLSQDTLQDIVDFVRDELRMMKPNLITMVGGRNKTLYSFSPALEKATKPNLEKTLSELGLLEGQIIIGTDRSTPKQLKLELHLTDDEMETSS